MRTLAISATLLLALTACGGADEEPAVESQAPSSPSSSSAAASDPVSVYVDLKDAGRLDALFNGDGGQCVTSSVADALSASMDNPNASPEEIRALLPTVQVELTNADGTTIGLEELPQRGGRFGRDGCTWSVAFDVEASDFYEVTVTRAGEVVATEQSDARTITVTF